MSRKGKRQGNHMKSQGNNMNSQTQDLQTAGETGVRSTAKETLESVSGTVNNHKVLIGSIAGACGAVTFLMATALGRRLRSGIQDRAAGMYRQISDQVSNGIDKGRSLIQDMRSGKTSQREHESLRPRRVA